VLSDLTREYYNQRVGQQRPVRFDRANLDRILQEQLIAWDSGGWLQEAFGYHCVDTGLHPGRLGSKFETYLLTEAHVAIAEPFYDHLSELSDADLFSLLEVLVQVVAKPVDGYHHNWNGCGWHYHTFAVPAGRREVTDRLNTILPLYDSGYQMAADGQVELALEEATSGIVDEPLPEQTPQPVQERVDAAVRRFRRGQSSWEDRHAAVRDLGDALESLRPRAKELLTRKDEGDLFTLLNAFGIRHLKSDQRTEYDREVFLKWMFYYLLASIHACLELIQREG
jgi:hypothetical protein